MDIVIEVLSLDGSNENKKEFVIAKVSKWVKQLEVLTNFACPEPHTALFETSLHIFNENHSWNFTSVKTTR